MRITPAKAAAAGLALLTALAASGAVAAPAQDRPGTGRGRQRPPSGFACAPDHLTAYTGVVTRYTRERGRTTLRVHTDWDTTEAVTLRHSGTDDPVPFFRYAGAPFTTDDWPRIELSKGVLRPATRATAWVCRDGSVLVDWAVPKE